MKKFLLLFLLIMPVLFTGCGQEVDLTVYNTGVSIYGDQWLNIHVQWDEGNRNMGVWGRAYSEDECDEYNSFTVKVKENSTIVVGGNGVHYVADAQGNTTLESYSYSESATVYGGFPSAPHWYGAVHFDGVTIYNK